MTDDIKGLVASRNGSELKALAEGGRHDAAMAFAQLVFDAKYSGDEKAAKTKKEAKDTAREDAFRFAKGAADAGDFNGCVFWADVCFNGVREPGNFGSVLRTSFYGEAEQAYDLVLNHPECPESDRGLYLIRKAQSIQFKSKIKGLDRMEEVISLLTEAASLESNHSSLAHFCLSPIYWDQEDYTQAVNHAQKCFEDYPYAALTLSLAYKNGKGVGEDLAEASRFYDLWALRTAPKRKGKK